jgi:cellulose synthase/poly-beta-1,6-N-acetylglucosamine synthase-like glycosyltransferase
VTGILLALASAPVLAACAYLFALALLSGRLAVPPWTREHLSGGRLRFDLVVPAHDEEAGIAGTVHSLLGLDYPPDLFRVFVVADNCSDRTAQRAREAGANVLLRHDPDRRGKGYALEHAFAALLRDGWAEAIVVVDADTVASKNLLRAFARHLAAGEKALQADYAVRNVNASWRTLLMAIALGLFHVVRSRARERLHLSCGLRGNGMCFSRDALERVPHRAFSIVEDLEYGIRLVEAGIRVAYAGEAHVFGEMVSTARAAASQRRRWEGGRFAMARLHVGRLLGDGLRLWDPVRLDVAADLLVPPLSLLAVLVVGGLGASLAAGSAAASALLGASAVFLAVYVLRGWMVSGTGARGLVALSCAPAFVAWKLCLLVARPRTREWVRTPREDQGAGATSA